MIQKNKFQGNLSPQTLLASPIDHAHAPAANFFDQLEVAESGWQLFLRKLVFFGSRLFVYG